MTEYRTVDVLTDLPPEERFGAILRGDLTLIPDHRLQDIADAWNEMSDRDRGRIRSWVPHFISTIEDALTEENNDDS